MTHYLYRRGDGNDGNFPRFIVNIGDSEDAFTALKALVSNDYIVRTRTRRHILANIEVDGETEYGLNASVSEGPEGETAFGAAWLTAALEPISAEDLTFYKDRATSEYTLRQVLDRSAMRFYKTNAHA